MNDDKYAELEKRIIALEKMVKEQKGLIEKLTSLIIKMFD